MRGYYKIRRAAKEHRCTEHSYHAIRPGTLYLSGACPPEHDANGGKTWWIIHACLRCAETYGLHSSDTRQQLKDKADESSRRSEEAAGADRPADTT